MALTPRDESLALRCPRCGYNLTGTAGDTCPECGAYLDRAELARLARIEPISAGQVALNILWPAMASFLVALVPIFSVVLLPMLWAVILTVCGAGAKPLARRVAYTRATRDSSGRFRADDPQFVQRTALGLFLAQVSLALAAGVGGCALLLSSIPM